MVSAVIKLVLGAGLVLVTLAVLYTILDVFETANKKNNIEGDR